MKITMIGAGSVVFTQNHIKDILSFANLRKDTTICLEDLDQKRLDLIFNYFKKYKEDNPKVLENVEFEATTNQKKAITDARYIISAIQAGGLDAYKIDMEIPNKYGVHQVVGDSLGPGGVFRFLRTIKAFDSILNDIQNCAEYGKDGSEPLFLNYTNPMAMNTWYCNEKVPNSTVGLCHGVQGTANLLKRWIGATMPGEFSFLCAGINHMAWFLKIWYKDFIEDPETKGPWMNAYPILKEHLEEEPKIIGEEKVRVDMYKATGYFMTESPGHLAEYLPYYLKRKDLIEKYRDEKSEGFGSLAQANYYTNNVKRLVQYQDQLEEIAQSKDLKFKNKPGEEYCSHIINAIESDEPFLFNGNLQNKNGLITNLPGNCCVEVPTTADAQGLHPQGGITLPHVCQALCMSNIMVQQSAVMGALERKKESIYHAVLLDPNTSSICSPEEIREMVDEMFEAQIQWIPKFN